MEKISSIFMRLYAAKEFYLLPVELVDLSQISNEFDSWTLNFFMLDLIYFYIEKRIKIY